MHVLFYINSLATGGAERTLVKLANSLSEANRITVVTQQPASMDQFHLHPAITRISTDSGTTSSSIWTALLNNLHRIKRLRAAIRTQQPDVVVAFMATANTVATFATRGLGIPVVVSERNYPPALPLSSMHQLAQRIANRVADHMVVLTEQTRRWYQQERGLTRLTVIPNGVTYPIPASTDQVSPEQWVEPDQKLLLCVGRIAKQKQPQLALKTFAKVYSEFPDWKLVWLGRGDTDALKEQASTLGIQDRFAAPGSVGNMQSWYERADVYLMTSAFEGFPNSLLEAMASGCASIALDCPTGPRDIIVHGQNGLLISLHDHETLCHQLGKLMRSADLRVQLGRDAKNVRETFSDTATHAAWQKLLTALVAPD